MHERSSSLSFADSVLFGVILLPLIVDSLGWILT